MNPIEQKLVKIREVAIEYLETQKPLQWEVHVVELRRGAIMNIDGVYRIGRWVFENETMTLLREADLAPEVRSYGMVFEQQEDRSFRVVQDFWEKESFDFTE